MPDTTPATDPVITAFAALRDALGAAALADPAQFDRSTSFRQHILRLSARYEAGEPAFSPKKRAA